MRCAYFFEAAVGYFKNETQRAKWQFNLHRLLATTLVNMQVKEEERVSPAELWESPFDEASAPDVEQYSVEQQQKMDEALINALNNIPNGNKKP